MSLHAELSPEALQRLHAQRRNSTISSVVIAFLVVVLVALVLGYFLLPQLVVEAPTIVTYESNLSEDTELEQKKVQTRVDRKPSSPSSSMAKVIAANTASPTAVPVPDVDVSTPSLDFGDGNDFGEGWGSDGDGGGGGTTFFGQTVKAKHFAYVIDFSRSMNSGGREALMRKELNDSIDQIAAGTHYALIFFAGPAWEAGSTVQSRRGVATVTGKNRKEYKWRSAGGHSRWEHDGKKQPIDWLVASKRQLKASKKIVEETQLILGTVWDNPLMMALEMDPVPQVIYFMTDGSASGSDVWAKEVGEKAKKLGVVINCVAMMQPKNTTGAI